MRPAIKEIVLTAAKNETATFARVILSPVNDRPPRNHDWAGPPTFTWISSPCSLQVPAPHATHRTVATLREGPTHVIRRLPYHHARNGCRQGLDHHRDVARVTASPRLETSSLGPVPSCDRPAPNGMPDPLSSPSFLCCGMVARRQWASVSSPVEHAPHDQRARSAALTIALIELPSSLASYQIGAHAAHAPPAAACQVQRFVMAQSRDPRWCVHACDGSNLSIKSRR